MVNLLLEAAKVPDFPARPVASPQSRSVNLIGVGFDGTACFPKGASAAPAAIRRVAEDSETYSPNLDLAALPPFFDPAFLPGSGTPEAGGEDFLSFIKVVKLLKTKKLVGADVVELAPAIDPTGNSDVFAAKVVRELILAFHGGWTGHVG